MDKKTVAKYKMIVCDLDGTLVVPGNLEFHAELCELVEEIHRKGLIFAVSTGRSISGVQKLFGDTADQIYSLCQNGSLLFRGREQIAANTIPLPFARQVVSGLRDIPGTYLLLTSPRGYYLFGAHHNEKIWYISDLPELHFVNSVDEIPEAICQITLFDFQHITIHMERIKALCGETLSATLSSDSCIDVNMGDKGAGLEMLCEELNLSPHQAICFGDNYNDLPMLYKAGLAYLVGDGQGELAGRIKKSCEDAPAKIRDLLSDM